MGKANLRELESVFNMESEKYIQDECRPTTMIIRRYEYSFHISSIKNNVTKQLNKEFLWGLLHPVTANQKEQEQKHIRQFQVKHYNICRHHDDHRDSIRT
uniref:Uncharacterized protein n=1 Tax=Opuntia streptacantha TaxID=393608 RepID=A0A7C9E3Q8_OPUST